MSNLFSGINIALRAVLAQQQAIQVIEHNVANASTPGYRRQEAVLRALVTTPTSGLYQNGTPGMIGAGVTVDRIQRFNLEFYDGRFRRETASARRFELQGEILKQVELTLAETGEDGLANRLDAFWTGWQALSDDPSNLALRRDLLERAGGLADALNWRASSLIALRKEQNLAIEERVQQINTLASHVARLNAEIPAKEANGIAANDLLDERDRLINQLSELTGATAHIQENGEALVSIGGHSLVVGRKAFTLTTGPDPLDAALRRITWQEDGQVLAPPSGELAGIINARDVVIKEQLAGLNTLAYTLASKVNEMHAAGSDLNGEQGVDFFTGFTPQANYALEIRVNPEISGDPARIAASKGGPGSVGDGSLAMEIAELRNTTLSIDGASVTINGYHISNATRLGLEVKDALRRAKDNRLVADSLEQLSESVGGVSLDEEAANLVKAQRAFQAASRLMTAIDDMLDRIINGMGTVGR